MLICLLSIYSCIRAPVAAQQACCNRDLWPAEPKTFTIWPATEKVHVTYPTRPIHSWVSIEPWWHRMNSPIDTVARNSKNNYTMSYLFYYFSCPDEIYFWSTTYLMRWISEKTTECSHLNSSFNTAYLRQNLVPENYLSVLESFLLISFIYQMIFNIQRCINSLYDPHQHHNWVSYHTSCFS